MPHRHALPPRQARVSWLRNDYLRSSTGRPEQRGAAPVFDGSKSEAAKQRLALRVVRELASQPAAEGDVSLGTRVQRARIVLPPSALSRPGIDPDHHLVAGFTVRAPGEVAAGVLARQLVDPGQGLKELELDGLAPDLDVAVGALQIRN